MQVIMSRQELLLLLGNIQGTISPKPPIPILGHILFEAANGNEGSTGSGQVVISAMSPTASARFACKATVKKEGKVALPARRFFQLLRELRSSQVEIVSKDQQSIEIIAGSSMFKIHGTHYSQFPPLPQCDALDTVPICALHLKELLVRSAFCAAREDSRYSLNGVYVESKSGTLTFTGTDGKRLARTTYKLEGTPLRDTSSNLPVKSVEELLRILDNPEEIVQVGLGEEKASFEITSGILITKLLSGQYPDVQKVIPKSPTHSISLHREELLSLLKQVSLFTSDSNQSVRFIFDQEELTLKAMASSIGEGVVSMPVNFSGEKLEIAFNPAYLIDILRRLTDDCITLAMNDSFNPGLITDSTTSQFVIMPMRLQDQEDDRETSVSSKAALT